MPQAYVLGSPIAHSLSPVLHRAAYASLGLTGWTYAAHVVDEGSFPAFVAGCGEQVRGLSLTMPLKEVAFSVAESISDRAHMAGAINTLVRRESGWFGDNTDIAGIVAALPQRTPPAGTEARDAPGSPRQETQPSVAERPSGRDYPSDPGATRSDSSSGRRAGLGMILGAGATARSAAIALRELGCHELVVCARDRQKALASLGELAGKLDVELTVRDLAAWASEPGEFVISTLPAAGALVAAQAIGLGEAQGDDPGLVGVRMLDVVYADWPTPLARAAGALGAEVVSGLDMLVHQAVEQVELMTDRRPDWRVLLAAGQSAIVDAYPAG